MQIMPVQVLRKPAALLSPEGPQLELEKAKLGPEEVRALETQRLSRP